MNSATFTLDSETGEFFAAGPQAIDTFRKACGRLESFWTTLFPERIFRHESCQNQQLWTFKTASSQLLRLPGHLQCHN